MRYALKSFTAAPVSERVKIDTAFHESLHKALSPYSPADSRLLSSHASESGCVLNHLHLMALHKATLLMLGQRQALDDMVAVDRQLPAGCYRRVWSILNANADAHMPFVQELAQHSDDRLVLAAQAGDTAALSRLLDAGVTVGLGTDGAASNNRLDLFQEMRQAALLAKKLLPHSQLTRVTRTHQLATSIQLARSWKLQGNAPRGQCGAALIPSNTIIIHAYILHYSHRNITSYPR